MKELKSRLKDNISLIEAKKVIWEDIIQQESSKWELFQVVVEERSIVAAIIEALASGKKEIQIEAKMVRKIVKFLNEKYTIDLKEIHIVDRVVVIVEINKVIEKN